MSVESIRALSDPKYEYYRLTKQLGNLKEGAIFYHDPNDDYFGSAGNGCIKLCWTPDGNCYTYCGGAVIFHYDFVKTDLFEKIELNLNNFLGALSVGRYTIKVKEDGTYDIQKCGIMDF